MDTATNFRGRVSELAEQVAAQREYRAALAAHRTSPTIETAQAFQCAALRRARAEARW